MAMLPVPAWCRRLRWRPCPRWQGLLFTHTRAGYIRTPEKKKKGLYLPVQAGRDTTPERSKPRQQLCRYPPQERVQ